MKKCLLALLIIAWHTALLAQEPFSSVEERMSGKEFQAAGLHKLTDEELRALNAWLREHSIATLDRPMSSPATAGASVAVSGDSGGDRRGMRPGKQKLTDEDKLITSRIQGAFDGWDGNTVFKLENGMVWKQDEKDVFRIRPSMDSPAVTIKKGLFNTWHLQVEGYNTRVRVERLQ